jgi:hypothetical protein
VHRDEKEWFAAHAAGGAAPAGGNTLCADEGEPGAYDALPLDAILRTARLWFSAALGLGRIVALCHRSLASYQLC